MNNVWTNMLLIFYVIQQDQFIDYYRFMALQFTSAAINTDLSSSNTLPPNIVRNQADHITPHRFSNLEKESPMDGL